ncbi:Checkpoint protein HUS1 [Harpegnathos saltator]|uniref:Checkpoint protein n=1 Tax=Harpegnathos saltator TaxID=610380 RepID=E2C4C2_HARSA|nr:Checkpoint protein HUS1 [Harpegnathos saltator]
MVDTGAMRDFTNIVNTISRMTRKYCVLRLTSDELCFNVGDEKTPVLWAVLSQEHFFTEYIMIGVCEDENEIYLEFDASMFARSLNSLKATAKNMKIKLTNKRQPCLTFEIDLSSLAIETRQCMHDVPVRLIPRKEWPEHKMPIISNFNVSLEIPQIKYLRHIVERMKNMSPKLTVIANKHGTLMLRIEVDHATVTSHFRELQIWMNRLEKQEDEDSDVSATVSIKKLAMFLSWDVLHPDSVKCYILHEKMIKLTMDIGDHVKMHYFEPAVAS